MGGRLLALIVLVCLSLAALPASAQETDDAVETPAAVEPTGLMGHVMLALRCPVPVGGDDNACLDRPLPSTLTLRSTDGLTELAQFSTDADGAFWIAVDPGDYRVDVGPRTIHVTVGPEGMTELLIRVPVITRP